MPASMRPRVFPAEDRDVGRVPATRELASMRPRVFPAEDPAEQPFGRPPPLRFNEAAGIPRGRLMPNHRSIGVGLAASMRPRVFPAEDACRSGTAACWPGCFNEAAGIPRGRPTSGG